MKIKDGSRSLEIARKTINLWIMKGQKYDAYKYPESFNQKAGCFTTLYTHPDHKLRGCIGYPEPFMPLIRSLVNSAIQATKDPRFPELRRDELDKIVVEVSLLTKPEELKVEKPEDYLKKIKIGKHGLIVRKWELSGLLLPQVATEHGMDARQFLEHTCMKAGLPPETWKEAGVKIEIFDAQVFGEKEE